MNYGKHVAKPKPVATPQSSPVPGKGMVANSASGFTFAVSPLQQVERFLILGSEGGSYYVSEKALTLANVTNLQEAIRRDGEAVVQMIADVSVSGRAPKNDPAIFALALAVKLGNEATRRAAFAAIPKVCRIGTHIFHFTQVLQDLEVGWGRGLRRAVSRFYTDRTADEAAIQVVKYRQRDGWSHRDVMRLAHPGTDTKALNAVLRYAVGKAEGLKGLPAIIRASEEAKALSGVVNSSSVRDMVRLIEEYDLPREVIPTEFLNSPEIWTSLLQKMPMTAMMRNLGKMTSIGVLSSNLDENTKRVRNAFANVDAIKRSRLHPLNILTALKMYEQGHGDKGSLSWIPVQGVVDSLDAAFYAAFQAVESTGKNFFLGVDCSGSMFGSTIAGSPLDSATAAGALALVTAATEPNHEIHYFSNGSSPSRHSGMGYNSGISPLAISPKMRLDSVMKMMQKASQNMGGTDCALPMVYAKAKKLPVDVFIVITDNETWAGSVHPFQALKDYRQAMGRPAKLLVLATEASPFTIADPSDAGMLDIVGFDTAVPTIIEDFASH